MVFSAPLLSSDKPQFLGMIVAQPPGRYTENAKDDICAINSFGAYMLFPPMTKNVFFVCPD